MVIGVRGMVASAPTAVVVGLGAFAAPPRSPHRRRPGSRPARPSSRDGRPPAAPPCTRASSPTPPVAGTCTANFVFTEGDRVFLGQAAHCAGTGEATETDGCSSATGPLGTEVAIQGSDGATARRDGLQLVGRDAGRRRDRPGPLRVQRLRPGRARAGRRRATSTRACRSSAARPACTRASCARGRRCSGTATRRLGTASRRFARRPARSWRPTAGAVGYEVYTVSPGIPGDSGSGYLTQNGRPSGCSRRSTSHRCRSATA